MKDIIKLIYVKDGNEYTTEINRALFLDQMERFVDWYSADGSNYNAQKLSDIIPVIDTIRINYSIIETQDVPFFEYTLNDGSEENILKLRRPFKIIWEILQYYCDKAVNGN